MKKIIVLVVLVGAVGAFAHRPSADVVPRQGAVETLWPLDMTRASRELPTEAYNTI